MRTNMLCRVTTFFILFLFTGCTSGKKALISQAAPGTPGNFSNPNSGGSQTVVTFSSPTPNPSPSPGFFSDPRPFAPPRDPIAGTLQIFDIAVGAQRCAAILDASGRPGADSLPGPGGWIGYHPGCIRAPAYRPSATCNAVLGEYIHNPNNPDRTSKDYYPGCIPSVAYEPTPSCDPAVGEFAPNLPNGRFGGTNITGKAIGRNAWALNCKTQNQRLGQLVPLFITAARERDGNDKAVNTYFVFGTISLQGVRSVPVAAPSSPDAPCILPDGYVPLARCEPGCFAADQEIGFTLNDGQSSPEPLAIEKAYSLSKAGTPLGAMSLSAESKMGSFQMRSAPAGDFIGDVIGDYPVNDFYKITGESGFFTVTPAHPVLLANGELLKAEEIDRQFNTEKKDLALMTKEGKSEKILSIKFLPSVVQRSFNFTMKEISSDPLTSTLEHIVAVGNYLTGDHYLQNQIMGNAGGGVDINRILLRDSLIPIELLQVENK